MRVILTTDMADKRHYWAAGTERDLPQKEATRLIQSGQAVPARSQPVETTARRRGRPPKVETAAS